ncbi:MAG: cytochrome c [bacterium]|nr:cytochrome c [bacterium]
MSIFYLKSILSIVLLAVAMISMFTMFEIFGKSEKKYNIEKLKKFHRINGRIYIIIFLFISYYCINSMMASKAELSSRGAFHSVFSLAVIVLFALKLSYIRIYKQYYGRVQMIGLLIALLTFGMMGTSGAYFLLVTKFGQDRTFEEIMEYKTKSPQAVKGKEEKITAIRTDPESIGKGKNLFDAKCSFCHDPYDIKFIVGPGLKGILKNPELPISKKQANAENIVHQLREPLSQMPSFNYLLKEDIENIIAFLNTL